MFRNQQRIVSMMAVVWPCLFATTALHAQPASVSSASVVTVPRLVLVTGTFTPASGRPTTSVETVTLAVYAEETGGVPSWQETQNVVLDKAGRFSLLVGATQSDGIPREVFASGEAQWLGLQFAGEVEQPRTRITSVPYALRSADADLLGGRPASAYMLAPSASNHGRSTTSAVTDHDASTAADVTLAGTPNFLAKYVTSTDVANSAIYEAGGAVGIGTTAPLDSLHVRFLNTTGGFAGYAVQNLGNSATSYSGMLYYDQNGALGQFQGFNNATHEYRINNIASGASINFMTGSVSRLKVRADGDLDLSGAIRKGGVPFLSSDGILNTFLGENAGNFTMTGPSNTATGTSALHNNATGYGNTATGVTSMANNTTGYGNTANGGSALYSNITGIYNTATGLAALFNNTTGGTNTANGQGALYSSTTGWDNTASGYSALMSNTIGTANTATGSSALQNNTTGAGNVGIGLSAGSNSTTGSYNIYLGAFVTGTAGESNTMYLGRQGTQTKTVIAGIRGITTGLDDAVPVVIDSAGQLGTLSSSRRFKEEIRDMGDASRAIFALRPVTFRYTNAYANGSKPLQYGLIAEEVAEVFPALAVPNAAGGVDTVHYETLSVLLLNEVQKQQQRIEALERRIEALLAKPD